MRKLPVVGGAAASGGAGGSAGSGGAGGSEAFDPTPRETRRHAVIMQNTPTLHRLNVVTQAAEAGCVIEAVSSVCELETCTIDPTAESADFGAVEVTFPGGSLTQTPDASGAYASVEGAGSAWSEGEAVVFEAEGAELPSFSETLVGPAQLTVMTDNSGGTWPWPAGEPLEVSWTGGGSANAIIALAVSEFEQEVQLRCCVPASTGSFRMEPELIERVGTDATLVVAAENRRVLPAGEMQETRLIARSETHSWRLEPR